MRIHTVFEDYIIKDGKEICIFVGLSSDAHKTNGQQYKWRFHLPDWKAHVELLAKDFNMDVTEFAKTIKHRPIEIFIKKSEAETFFHYYNEEVIHHSFLSDDGEAKPTEKSFKSPSFNIKAEKIQSMFKKRV